MMLLVCLLGLTANCCALWFCWLGPFVFSVIIKIHTAFYCQSHNFDVPLEIHFCLFIKYSVLLSHANGAVILTPSLSLWPLKFVNSEKWFFFSKEPCEFHHSLLSSCFPSLPVRITGFQWCWNIAAAQIHHPSLLYCGNWHQLWPCISISDCRYSQNCISDYRWLLCRSPVLLSVRSLGRSLQLTCCPL